MAFLSKLKKLISLVLKTKRNSSVVTKKCHSFNSNNSRIPVTIEERWRTIRNLYYKDGGYDPNSKSSENEFDLIRVCGACGFIKDHKRSEMGEMEDEEKGHYAYGYHVLSRAERKQRRLQMERIITREIIETERLLKKYQNGDFNW